jgi:hypothetical protein
MATRTVAQPPVNVSDLQEQFMSHAENVLNNNQLSLAMDGKTALAIEFNQGVAKMITDQRTSAADIGEAHRVVGVYAQGIVLQARAAQAQQVNANIIQRVKQFLCPGLWPFC